MAGWHHWLDGRWVWVNSRSWWWTERPGVLQFMGSQRIGHDWATELNVLQWAHNEAQGVPEVESSAILDLIDSDCFSSSPQHLSLCPAPFPLVSVGQVRTFQNPRKAGRVKIWDRVSFKKCLHRLLLLKVRVSNISWSTDVTELNWVCSLATWQNQFTDTGLWWQKVQCLFAGNLCGQLSCCKDPNSPTTFREGFFFLIETFFLYLILAALGLCCCTKASRCGGFSCFGAWAPGMWGSVVVVPEL